MAENIAADKLDDFVAEIDSGGRKPLGMVAKLIASIAFVWSSFQLFLASSIPFWLSQNIGVNLVFNNQEARQIHLAFAIALATLAFPLFKKSPKTRIPLYDWILAILGVTSCLYLLVFKDDIANRAGLPTIADLIISTIGMVSIAIAVFRSLGLPMLMVASVFVLYVFAGHLSFMPEVVQWKGASFSKAMWHFWMQTEGVFGVALGVSASMIFLFVLFGSLLERAGAGNYFIQLALALLGHLRGGPAKAAVVASGLSGLYSGSSIANVVTTGTFTIPLMRKTGFTPEKAGAVEVASSTNGQLTPPVMGAAAFLIAEFTGISYTDIIRHALLPALVSYIALFYIVHLEAMKLGLQGMQRPPARLTVIQKLLGVLSGFIGIAVLGGIVYYGLGSVAEAFPDRTALAGAAVFLVMYLVLITVAARRPDLEVQDPKSFSVLPHVRDVALTGLHYLLPIVVLLWSILIERLSPSLSAFWASVAMVFVVLTQDVLKGIIRGDGAIGTNLSTGISNFADGMISGARNMIPIGVATGVAGIIIGTVSLTGAHQVVGEFVEFLSGGNLMLMLFLVAVMSLILGMGLPTTANYIVVSSLMAPVIVSVGAQSGLVVPLIAVHMFVFYFGILADDTPPVGLAAFAAGAISGGDPIKTGIQGFTYDIRTALLPFLFIFNTELLLIDVTLFKAVFIFVIATIAMLLFAAATQGFFLTRSRIWETVALLLISFTLFRPGYWLDQVSPPYERLGGDTALVQAAEVPDGGSMRMILNGPDFDDPDKTTRMTVVVPLGAGGDGQKRLEKGGLMFRQGEPSPDGTTALDEPLAGTAFYTKLQKFDFFGDQPVVIETVEKPTDRIAKEVFYIPAVLLLLLVIFLQKGRARKAAA